jgi:putative ABC transport system ATP-binding protein
MGPSGSGKTTLLNCIACILEPSSGRLTLDGEVVYEDRWLQADLRRLRLDKIGFIFQYPNRELFSLMSRPLRSIQRAPVS